MSLFLKRGFIFLSLVILGWSNVLANTIQDKKTGFSVEVNFPKTSVCVVYPDQSYNADNCPIDNYLFPTEDAVVIARGVVRFEAAGEMLFNIAQIKAPFTAPMSQKEAEIFIGKYLALFNVSETQTLDSGMVVVNSQPFYRYYGDVGLDTALPYSRLLFYSFSGKGYHYFISFNFDLSQEKKAFEISDQILRSIKVPLPEHSERGELIYQLSYEVIFSSTLFIALFLLFSFSAWLVNRCFPKIGKLSLFQGRSALALERFSRFAVLSILIVGIYETSIVFRSWESLEIFLMAYAIGLATFILVRLIWRWILAKWLKLKFQPTEQEQLNTLFFPIGIPKLIILSIFTCGLYSFYWFYKNWVYVQHTTEEPVNPVLKAIFYPICAYFLFKRINQEARKLGSPLRVNASLWSFILIVCFLIDMIPLGNILTEWLLFLLGLLMFVMEFAVLLPAQRVINQLNKQYAPQADLNRHFTWMDGVICVVGAFILALMIYLLYA